MKCDVFNDVKLITTDILSQNFALSNQTSRYKRRYIRISIIILSHGLIGGEQNQQFNQINK